MKKGRVSPEKLTRELVGFFSIKDYCGLERRALEATAMYPNFAFAWKVLSVALSLTGGDALPAARRAATLLPGDPEAQNNFAKALLDAGHADESRRACLTALKVDPAHVMAMNNLGNACRKLGRFDEARKAYLNALQLAPKYFDVAFNLGNMLSEAGDLEGSIAAFRHSLNINPAHQASTRLLARQLTNSGCTDEAIDVMRTAAMDANVSADLLSDLACLWMDIGDASQALAEADRALKIDSNNAFAHNQRGTSLTGLERLTDARRAFERSVEIDATQAKVWINLGNVLRDLLLTQEALSAYARAVEAAPPNPEIYSSLLLASNYLGNVSGLCVDKALASQNERGASATAWSNDPDPVRTLRVGFVSGDLCNHPVGRFLVAPLAELCVHNVDVFAYANQWRSDEVTNSLRESIRNWRNIQGVSDEKVVEMIQADRIDILIDLSGHTKGGRLNIFARKPAPLQVAWFGYFASTGLKAIDYVLADDIVLPECEEHHFVEKVWRLPATYYCYTPPQAKLDCGPLPALSTGQITFACFNNAVKVGPDVLSCWAEILRTVPNSILFFKSRHFSLPEVVATMTERLAALGVSAEQLRFEAADSFDRYLAAYQGVDIALDPFPFTGGATTADALWMGVPVLTMRGQRFISHQGETIMNSVGLNDWIADGADQYVALARAKVSNLEDLAKLRGGLRERLLASAFADAAGFATNLQSAWRGMWVSWCDEQRAA